MSVKQFFRPLFMVVTLAIVSLPGSAVFAQTSSSANYKTNEYSFGSGGDPNLTSPGYQARAQAGDLGNANSSSTNFTANPGSVTPREEYLEMVITNGTVNLGNLLTSSAATATGTFYIRDYTSSGYVVKTITGTPAYGGTSLAAMTSTALSSPGTEQFGINLAANTSPATFGAIPAPQPSGYAYGVAAAGYGTQNQFKYNAGDTIATSPKGIGQTNYTISYIANISTISKAGLYSVNQVLVVVATY